MGDLNSDSRPDLVVANSGANTISVLLNTTAAGSASATFATNRIFSVGLSPYGVAIADVDGDGKTDIIVANNGGNSISLLRSTTAAGAGVPSFAVQQVFSVGGGPTALAVVDLNGDGHLDLVSANGADSTVSLLMNTTYQVLIAGSPATGTISHTFTVTPTVSGSHGTINPNTPQLVGYGRELEISLTPASGFVPSVSGTCGGTLSGNTYTTNPAIVDCTVVVSFVPETPIL